MASPLDASCHTEAPALLEEDPWQQVLALLPVDVEASARAAGAWRRRRQVPSAAALLRVLLLYCVEDWSLRLTGAWAAVLGLGSLSESALRQRLGRSRCWLGTLVAALLAVPPGLARVGRVRLIDATAGTAAGGVGTAWRVHLSYDVQQGALSAVEVTDAHGGETLRRQAVEPGDILVADAGYSHPAGLAAVLGQGGQVLVRWAGQTLPLQDPTGEPLDPLPWLRTLPAGAVGERAVHARGSAGPLALRLLGRPLAQAAAERARQRVRRHSQKQGRTPSARSLELAGYLVLVTSLAPTAWSAEAVLRLYRLRWQVELVFKRLKSLWHLDAGRAQGASGQVYLLGTLLAALLAARLSRSGLEPALAWFSAVERPLSLWRWDALGRLLLRQAVLGQVEWAVLAARLPALQRYLCDSPRHKRSQQAAQGRGWLNVLLQPLSPPVHVA